MENHIIQELTAMEQLAKVRLERIQELKDMINSRRDMAQAYREASTREDTLNSGGLWQMAAHLNAEADALQATLDTILAAPLGDYPKNGEPRSIDSQSNW